MSIGTALTFLFVPGDRPDRFSKAAAAGADHVIVDLEDAVRDERKQQAREDLRRWLSEGGRALVRLNGVASAHHAADLEATARLEGLEGLVLPRAEQPEDVADLAGQFSTVPIIALIETAAGLVNARRLASVPGVVRLAFGDLDYAVDLGAELDSAAMQHARCELVVASRAAGLTGPVDGVTPDVDNPSTAGSDARRGRALGLGGKLCLHPSQIPHVRAAFTPTETELMWARTVLTHAAVDGSGASRLNGQLVDRPVVLRAEAIVLRAQAQ